MYMIVGLGNPGREYAQTRHNMGFLTLEVLAARWQIPITVKGFQGLYGKGLAEGQRVMLVAPQTYMNASGECVGAMARYFDVPLDHILVIYDDIDLPVGRLRVRQAGSAGTHNGMKSLIAHLGGGSFPRIRVGVGKPGCPWRTLGWAYRPRQSGRRWRRPYRRRPTPPRRSSGAAWMKRCGLPTRSKDREGAQDAL